MTNEPEPDPARGPRRAALAVCAAAGKILFLAMLLPAARSCDQAIVPAGALVEPDLFFLLLPHLIGLTAAVAAVLFWRRWQSPLRGLEIALVVVALLAALGLGAFFFFAIDTPGGPALAALCLALVVALFARAQNRRWRAARALWILGALCTTWYLFWIVLFSMVDDSGDVILYCTYVATGASVLVFASARRLESTVPRWRSAGRRPPE